MTHSWATNREKSARFEATKPYGPYIYICNILFGLMPIYFLVLAARSLFYQVLNQVEQQPLMPSHTHQILPPPSIPKWQANAKTQAEILLPPHHLLKSHYS